MSLDRARAFFEKMKSDEAFRDRIIAIEGVDARLVAASSAGFQFTESELKEVQIELTDDQLDAAAGGGRSADRGFAVPAWIKDIFHF
jgi:predicted ribosomally synthesized peptide with nif11-like leader